MCSREIFTKKCRQQKIFDSDLKGAWHYNHVTFTPIAKNFMLYCRLIYMLSILCVRLMIKVKEGIPESFKVGWYPLKKTGSSHLKSGADLGGGCRGCRGCVPPPPPEMTCGFLIQLVFCKKKTMWFIGVEVEQETSAPPPKKILDPPL